ncbi:MAG: phospholipase, partial [Acetobacteraceae bacterium]|nr:phospholipase [Acetobacteraceae bacterium]
MAGLDGPRLPPRSGGPARQLVVLLHGVGADGADLIGFAPFLAEALPDAAFVAPDAPQACDMAPFGRQWFSLLDRDPARLEAGARAVEPAVRAFLEAELSRLSLPASALALAGFSQGAMTALHAGLRMAEPPAAI